MTLNTASVLAFERKLEVSDGLFFAGLWESRSREDAWPAVTLREKSVRGTISNRLKSKEADPAKRDASIENSNLQIVDVACLPQGCDTLKLSYTLRVLPGVGQPSVCNNVEYRKKLTQTVKSYLQTDGMKELSRRYACNIANGRSLWRNRIGAEQIEVNIKLSQQETTSIEWNFNALEFSLHNFEVPKNEQDNIEKLAEAIHTGLSGTKYVLLDIEIFARIGKNQEVFPSQELIFDQKNKKSKTLYHVNGIAGMHSQKIGNALRTIDTWYPGFESEPIAVEPYGSVTTLGKAYRQPKEKVDFYSLLDDWVLKDKKLSLENMHFVIAVLIRGGVFGEKE